MYSRYFFGLLVVVAIGPLQAVPSLTDLTCGKLPGGISLPKPCTTSGTKCCTVLSLCLTDAQYNTACGTATCTKPGTKDKCPTATTCCPVNLQKLLGTDLGNLNTVNTCLPTCPSI